MFLYGDVVKAPKHSYIVVDVDDSKPEQVRYGLVPCTKANLKSLNRASNKSKTLNAQYWYNANVLDYVVQA